MENPKLGETIQGPAQKDAIHIAIYPAIAAERLYPGQHVGVAGELAGPSNEPVGIVDPFLKHPIEAESKFYIFIYPNTVTSLRHEWTHPAFGDIEASKLWLKEFAVECRDTYERLIDGAKRYLTDDNARYCIGEMTPDTAYSQVGRDEFWMHFTIATGIKVPKEKTERNFISCAC